MYLGINVKKYVQELHEESCKTHERKQREDLNKWENILYTWIGRLSIVKM